MKIHPVIPRALASALMIGALTACGVETAGTAATAAAVKKQELEQARAQQQAVQQQLQDALKQGQERQQRLDDATN